MPIPAGLSFLWPRARVRLRQSQVLLVKFPRVYAQVGSFCWLHHHLQNGQNMSKCTIFIGTSRTSPRSQSNNFFQDLPGPSVPSGFPAVWKGIHFSFFPRLGWTQVRKLCQSPPWRVARPSRDHHETMWPWPSGNGKRVAIETGHRHSWFLLILCISRAMLVYQKVICTDRIKRTVPCDILFRARFHNKPVFSHLVIEQWHFNVSSKLT